MFFCHISCFIIFPTGKNPANLQHRTKQTGSDNMTFKKTAVILLSLSVFLSGCSSGISNKGSKKTEKGEEIADIQETVEPENQEPVGTEIREPVETDGLEPGEKTGESSGTQNVPADVPAPGDNSKEGKTSGIKDADNGTKGTKTGDSNSEKSPTDQAGKKNTDNAAKESSNVESSKSNNDGLVKLIPMAKLPDLNMDPQEPFTLEEKAGMGTCMLVPVYHKTLRYQIREFTRNPSRLVIDIGNTSDKTIVITDENMYFSILDMEGNNIAGSKVQGAPVSIAPGEIKRVVVTAQNPDAGIVFFEFEQETIPSISVPIFRPFPNEAADVTDTTPYNKHAYITNDDEGNPFIVSQHPMQVVGNGKAKMVGCGLMILENEKIGPVEKQDGFLALVKVRIANTSNEVMTINRLTSHGGGQIVDLTEKDLAVLGDKALPFTIKPHSIVEGWIPFKVREARDGHGIVFYTNLGGFILGYLQTYPVFER